MTRQFATALAILLLGAPVAVADWDQFWHGVHVDYHRNNGWPHPFREMSAAQTLAPFGVMVNNGWRSRNTLGHELFRPGDSVLTSAGEMRLRWIATQVPPERRVVFVLRSPDQQETEARTAAVRNSLAKMWLDGPAPQVMLTNIEPPKASGEYHNRLNQSRLEQLPPPRLPGGVGTSASGR